MTGCFNCEPVLVVYVINTIFSCAGSFYAVQSGNVGIHVIYEEIGFIPCISKAVNIVISEHENYSIRFFPVAICTVPSENAHSNMRRMHIQIHPAHAQNLIWAFALH